MKSKIAFCLLTVIALSTIGLTGCKKSHPSPVGNWKLDAYSYRAIYIDSASNVNDTTFFIYNSNNDSLIRYRNSHEINSSILSLQMDLRDDGTVTVTQVGQYSSGPYPASTRIFTGNWQYSKSRYSGETIEFNGLQSSMVSNDGSTFGQSIFNITVLEDNNLTLTYTYTYTTTTPSNVNNTTSTLSFSR